MLLSHPDLDINRRNNDRLTSFMLAMQGGPLIGLGSHSRDISSSSNAAATDQVHAQWPGWVSEGAGTNAQEKMKRLMDLPATDDLEWTRHDRYNEEPDR